MPKGGVSQNPSVIKKIGKTPLSGEAGPISSRKIVSLNQGGGAFSKFFTEGRYFKISHHPTY